MAFRGIQKTFRYQQTNLGDCERVFVLLCPVREADWIDGWEYEMVHSESGMAELNCVFQTPFRGDLKTTWQITQYDKEEFRIEFVRLTPGENIVRINIELQPLEKDKTKAQISYRYTGLNETQNQFISNELNASFLKAMIYWEKAINHYLLSGNMLPKT